MPATLESVPVPVLPERLRRVETVAVERYRKALGDFVVPEDDKLEKRLDNSIRQHPSADVEGYFEWVTRHGKPAVPWDTIRPAFLWKIKFVMDEMIRLEKLRLKEGESMNFEEGSPLRQAYDFILEKAAEFDGAPFTWQRICELLHTPSRHYKKADKFIRALDKTINVVTTITETGQRITGVDWAMPADSMNGKIEQQFFGRVDEVDGAGDLFSADFKIATVRPVLAPPVVTPAVEEQAEPLDMTKKAKEDGEVQMKDEEKDEKKEEEKKEEEKKEEEKTESETQTTKDDSSKEKVDTPMEL